jgi:hypothetical protein
MQGQKFLSDYQESDILISGTKCNVSLQLGSPLIWAATIGDFKTVMGQGAFL